MNSEKISLSKVSLVLLLIITLTFANFWAITANIISYGTDENNANTQHLNLNVSQKVTKYVPFDYANKRGVILQVDVKVSKPESIKSLAIKELNLLAKVPKIGDTLPESVTVTARKTECTNGQIEDYVVFSKDNWEYNKEKETVYINTKNEGNIEAYDGEDEYFITYIYGENVYEAIKEGNQNIISQIMAKVAINNEQGETEAQGISGESFSLSDRIGNIATIEVASTTGNISKGRIYANYISESNSYETEFGICQKINVSYNDNIESLRILDKAENLLNKYKNKTSLNVFGKKYTYYKQTIISKTNLEQLLGENGRIRIIDKEGNILYEINKKMNTDNGYYVINYPSEIDTITIETSSPITEGNLNIYHTKAIKANLPFDKNRMEGFLELQSSAVLDTKAKEVDGFNQSQEREVTMGLEEPTTNAEIGISNNEISTINKNENIDIGLKLDDNRGSSELYTNPEFKIVFPTKVKNVEVKNAKIIYNDELKIKEIKQGVENGRIIIYVTLEGNQTKFSEGSITKGTNIILTTDIVADPFAGTSADKLQLYYKNEIAKIYTNPVRESNQTYGFTDCDINFIAPTGLISVNSIANFDDTGVEIASINQGEIMQVIPVTGETKTAKMKLRIMNNTGATCSEIVALGRVPFEGNKDVVTGEDLETTVDAIMKGEITVEGIDPNRISIYYSENKEATTDLKDVSNEWKRSPGDYSKVKSFLIVGESYEMTTGTVITLSYDFEIPANLERNNFISGSFVTNFKCNEKTEKAKADRIILTTGTGPKLKVELESTAGEEIYPNKPIKYTLKVTNTGTETATDVYVEDKLSDNSVYVRKDEGSITYFGEYELYSNNENSEEIRREWNVVEDETMLSPKLGWNLGNIEPKQTITKEFEVLSKDIFIVNKYLEELEEELDTGLETYAVAKATNIEEVVQSNITKTNIVNPEIGVIEVKGEYLEGNVSQDVELNFSVSATNRTDKELKNVVVEKYIPDGFTYRYGSLMILSDEGEITENKVIHYNEETKMMSITLDSIQPYDTIGAIFTVKTSSLEDGVYEKTVKTNTTVYADGTKKYSTEEIETTIEKPQLTIIEDSNIANKYLNNGDMLEYTVTVKNEGTVYAKNVEITKYVPEELRFMVAKYSVNGEESYIQKNAFGEVTAKATLNPEEEMQLNVIAMAEKEESEKEVISSSNITGDNVDVTVTDGVMHYVEAYVNDGKNRKTVNIINTENITNEVMGDFIEYQNKAIEQTEVEEEALEIRKYKLDGIAWIDENENGIREKNEQLLPNVSVTLVNSASGQVVIDQDSGIPKKALTDENGEYKFTNLLEGSYIVVFEYDYNEYGVTEYQKEGVKTDVNSDAVEAEIIENNETKTAGVTEIIKLEERSISNIDIGLTKRPKFDLKLEKYIKEIRVENNKTKIYKSEERKIEKIDIKQSKLEETTVYIEYILKVMNEGTVPGYATKIVDYIDSTLEFNEEENKNWYKGEDGNLYTKELENVLLQPGEYKEISIKVSKKMTEENIGEVTNSAEIVENYNEKGLNDVDSIPGNKSDSEDDFSSVSLIIDVDTSQFILWVCIVVILLAVIIAVVYVNNQKIKTEEE